METTKIYLIIAELNGTWSRAEKTLGFTLSREDAEYEIWKLNKETKRNDYNRIKYTYTEVPAVSIEKPKNDKDYKNFVAERIEDLKSQITAKTICKNKDIEALASLELSLKHYEDKK